MNLKIITRYGLYSAALLMVLGLISHAFLGTSPDNYGIGEIVGYSSIILSLVIVYFGIRQYRNDHLQGDITFWQALKVGLLISLFPAIAFGIYNVIYVEFIDPEFMDKYYNHQLAQMQASMSKQEFQVAKADMESQKDMFMNPTVQFFIMFLTVWLIGLVISTVSSFSFVLNKSNSNE